MTLTPKELTVPVNENDKVSAILYPAAKSSEVHATLILGHGAGANQLSPFIRMFGVGLAERGFDVLTFNFLYMEQKRRAPDPKAKLEACYSAVIDWALHEKKLKNNRVIIGGKSMGGRIASQVAAGPGESITDAVSGLVFLGYPLHPPGKPDQLRDKHLADIRAPMLFIQGSRDAFGAASEIASVINRLKLPASLYVVSGGDHSLKVSKSGGPSQTQVYESAMDEIAGWAKTAPGS